MFVSLNSMLESNKEEEEEPSRYFHRGKHVFLLESGNENYYSSSLLLSSLELSDTNVYAPQIRARILYYSPLFPDTIEFPKPNPGTLNPKPKSLDSKPDTGNPETSPPHEKSLFFFFITVKPRFE